MLKMPIILSLLSNTHSTNCRQPPRPVNRLIANNPQPQSTVLNSQQQIIQSSRSRVRQTTSNQFRINQSNYQKINAQRQPIRNPSLIRPIVQRNQNSANTLIENTNVIPITSRRERISQVSVNRISNATPNATSNRSQLSANRNRVRMPVRQNQIISSNVTNPSPQNTIPLIIQHPPQIEPTNPIQMGQSDRAFVNIPTNESELQSQTHIQPPQQIDSVSLESDSSSEAVRENEFRIIFRPQFQQLMDTSRETIAFVEMLGLQEQNNLRMGVQQLRQLQAISRQVFELNRVGHILCNGMGNVFAQRIRHLQATIVQEIGNSLLRLFRMPHQQQGFTNEQFNHTFRIVKTSQNQNCPICLEGVDKGVKMQCSHWFHQDCIKEWLRNSSKCPMCRFVQVKS